MKKLFTLNRAGLVLALALISGAATASAETAAENSDAESRHESRRGLVLGLNAGAGASGLSYKDGIRSIDVEPTSGLFGGLRIGYAFSPKLTLSLESFGLSGVEENEEEWEMGAGFVALTWFPRGSGFYVRVGAGTGSGDFLHPDTDQKLTLSNRLAGLFGVGYDWWVGDNVSLGIAADGFSLDGDSKSGFDDDHLSTGGVTVQLNWYL